MLPLRLRLLLQLALLLAWACWAAPALAQTLRIDSAVSVAADAPAFPADAPALLTPLPDDWARSRPGADGPVWYRAAFQAVGVRQRGELLALYVEHACTNLEVWLNGRLVHRGGRLQPPPTHNCQRPQLVSLPAALLEDGRNVLDIKVVGRALPRVASWQRAGGLSALQIGPHAELQRRHALRTALQVTGPQTVGAALLLTGGFLAVLGFVNRRDSHLAYFGAVSVGWALLDLRLWLPELPVPDAAVEFALCTLVGLIAWMAVQFLLRYARQRIRLVDWLLPLQALLLPVSLAVAGPDRLYWMASFWYALLSLEVGAAAALHLRSQWAERGGQVWPLAALMAAVLVTGATEFLAQRTGVRTLPGQVAQVLLPMLIVLMGLRLVLEHGRALRESESDRAHLEGRIREATAEIERNFRLLAELRVEQVTERERKRIAADLHDDLGAKLLTIVHTSESDRISTLAREALEEMRLSVRGLTGKPVRLADALGDWRAEVVSRLAQAGIEAEWSAPEDLPHMLSARAYVQTTRILREAVSNIIKHSKASHCQLSCAIADGDFQLTVQDNGAGISMELDGRLDRGHGMASMKARAKQLQGQCLVESGPGFGTVIRLTLPLDRAVEAA